jgi:hypothetical protein
VERGRASDGGRHHAAAGAAADEPGQAAGQGGRGRGRRGGDALPGRDELVQVVKVLLLGVVLGELVAGRNRRL